MKDLRIPFEIAISDKRLLKNRFYGTEAEDFKDGLSLAQRVMLKTTYGLKLPTKEEQQLWDAQQGRANYDELGYVVDTVHHKYVPKKYRQVWIVGGRRLGKSDAIASTIVAYEACFGGHEAYMRKGQLGYCYQIAQDMRMAAYSLHFIYSTIKSSQAAMELLDGPPVANEIRLKNNIVIKVLPPTLKSVRGFACPVAVLDEVGVWYQESDSANPDYEIYDAISPAQMQFPDRLIVGISSPYNKAGLLYKYWEAGTEGKNANEGVKRQFQNTLVIHCPTAAAGNPTITRESLEEEKEKDPKAFERECLAIFQDSISGFLSSALIREATQFGVRELEPDPTYTYVAAIDPAFRHDAFAFTIFHVDEDGWVVQDVIRREKAPPGGALNPDAVFSTLYPILKAYNVVVIYTDQYHLESLQQLAFKYGFVLEGVPFKASNKAQIYGSLQQLLNQRRLRLLDEPECLKELRQLERKLTGGGVVQIHAPQGAYDDLASVCALCAYKCLWLVPKPLEEGKSFKEPSVHEQIRNQINRKRFQNVYSSWD